VKVIVCVAGNSVPVGYTQPTGYGQPAGMVGYQQPMMMGTWQPGMMGMPGMAYGSQPGMMAVPAGPMAPGVGMQPRPPMGYMQQPVPMGMQAPAAYPPSAFSTSLHAGTGLRQWSCVLCRSCAECFRDYMFGLNSNSIQPCESIFALILYRSLWVLSVFQTIMVKQLLTNTYNYCPRVKMMLPSSRRHH